MNNENYAKDTLKTSIKIYLLFGFNCNFFEIQTIISKKNY